MLKHYYNGTLQTTAVLLDDEHGLSAAAVVGQVDMSTIYVQDPDGTRDYVPYKVWKMVEDACPAGNQVVWHGYVGDAAITRKAGAGYQIGSVARIWKIELIEDNGWPSRQVIIAASADRPAETVSARITWVLTMRGMTGIIYDHGLVEACTTALDATDYRNRTAKDVLDDCALLSGYNWFVRYREASDDIELIFQAPDSTADPAALTISNVNPNLTTEWPPNDDARQEFGASRIASGILLPYAGGTDYDQDTATAAAFGTVDQTAPTSAVKTKTKARAQITRLLAQHDEQDVSIENLRLHIPAANLNDVKQGQVISSVKVSHFKAPFDTGNRARVKSRAFSRPPNRTQAFYDVDLSLSPMACVPAVLQQGQLIAALIPAQAFEMPFTPAAGSFLLAYLGYRDLSFYTLPGWTLLDQRTTPGSADTTGWVWKVADGTEQYFGTSYDDKEGYVYEVSCASGAQSLTSTYATGAGDTMTCASVTAPGPGLVLGGLAISGAPIPDPSFCGNVDHRAGGAYPAVVPGAGYALDWTGQEEFHPMMSIVSKSISAAGSYTPSGYKDSTLPPWVYNGGCPQFIAWAIAVTA